MTGPWERRLRRIEALEARWPFARDVLAFLRAVVAFQRELQGRLPADSGPEASAPFAPAFLGVVESEGPPALAEAAGRLRSRDESAWRRDLGAYWRREAEAADPVEAFFPRSLLEPAALNVPVRSRDPNDPPAADCPACGRPPGASLLREDPEADALIRRLVCSFCAREWSFPRVLCPRCREESPEKLSRYTADGIPWIRVEACETCRFYLKGIDVTKEPRADPVVDEIASTPLDVIARERGLTKIVPNLMGM